MDRFAGTTSGPVAAGSTITVHFENSSLANQKVTIEAEGDDGQTEAFEIQLDGDGKGTAQFDIPADWTGCFLKHPTSDAHAVHISP